MTFDPPCTKRVGRIILLELVSFLSAADVISATDDIIAAREQLLKNNTTSIHY